MGEAAKILEPWDNLAVAYSFGQSPQKKSGDLLFQYKVKENTQQFVSKVRKISSDLGINPNWLMAVMNSESGINHRIENKAHPFPDGFATGLIQFIPSTARRLGTTTAALKRMTNVQQLDYVYQYFEPYAFRMRHFADVYLVTFFPAAIGKPKEYVMQTSSPGSAQRIALANKIFDLNKDKKITVGEFQEAIFKRIPKEFFEEAKKKVISDIETTAKKNTGKIAAGVFIIEAAGFAYWKRKEIKATLKRIF